MYSTANLSSFINTARLQLAGESGCVRAQSTLTTTGGVGYYNYSDFTGLPAGIQGIYSVYQGLVPSGSGYVYLGSRPWPWAQTYWLNNADPVQGQPTEFSQYAIGSGANGLPATGSLYLNPVPDTVYDIIFDISGAPGVLINDNTLEIIPYPYTDCVPFYAAFYAYMSAQRQSDADTMYGRYKEYLARAQRISVPHVLPMQYDQYMPPQVPAAGNGGR